MLKLLLILIGLMSFFTIFAQQVTNIKVTQEGDKVVINYDTSSERLGQTFDIKVECSNDNGKTFTITPLTLTGDLNDVSSGNGKRIVWDVLSERQELAGDQIVFQLVLSNSTSDNSGTFTDPRDGHVYKWVKIGAQIWMAENLRTTKYNDGSNIQNVTDVKTWANLTIPGYCWYNNDAANKNTFGSLYNWYATNTGKLAPIGWHIPSDTEWTILTTFLGGESGAGGKLKETGKIHWTASNSEATNETVFTALPGGDRCKGTFSYVGLRGYWWSSTADYSSYAWSRYIGTNTSGIYRLEIDKDSGFSVRCIKD